MSSPLYICTKYKEPRNCVALLSCFFLLSHAMGCDDCRFVLM